MEFIKASGASIRELGKSEREGQLTRIVRASRTYPTNQSDLWNALTDKVRIERWFTKVSGDFELGGRFTIKDNADGEIIACEPPETLALTWEFGATISWVRITVEGVQNGSLLTLEQQVSTLGKPDARL